MIAARAAGRRIADGEAGSDDEGDEDDAGSYEGCGSHLPGQRQERAKVRGYFAACAPELPGGVEAAGRPGS